MRRVSDEELHGAASTVAAEYDLELVVLFGSAARGDRARAEDMDLAVRAHQPVDAIALTNRFIQLLHIQEIDLVDLRRADARARAGGRAPQPPRS